MIMKRYYLLYIISALVLGSCSDEDVIGDNTLTEEQKALIGTAVNFNASMAQDFTETRASYNHEGKFNEGDIMQIYRQYWDGVQNKWEDLQAFRTYSYDVTYATGTSINLSTDWKVSVNRMKCDDWNSSSKTGTMYAQTKADSLTWENGATVRFRAWSRSNVAGCLSNGTAGSYYPDFCIADWVTVSGPTTGIPLTLRHVCSRIGFSAKAGNQFYSAEVCLNKEDYMWDDNDNDHDKDLADKLSEEEAQQVVEEINAVYNRMCLPAGVDIESGTLRAMTNTLYNNLSTNKQFNIIEQKTVADGIVEYGTKSPAEIATDVKHPSFSNVDGRLYMITIPYDMSNDPSTQGDVLTIPAKTRFRIKLRDVNNGDHNTSGYEYKEHIFSLSDIKNSDGTPVYPDGLQMVPGKSYRFTVGYLYDKLTVTVIEEGINWSTAEEESGETTDQHVSEHNPDKFKWWKDAINTAITETKSSKDYNPIFKISTAEEFKEFIALVNGTAATKTSGLERAVRSKDNPDADPDLDSKETKKYWWYDVEKTKESLATEFGDTVWLTRTEAEAQGYVFFRHYYPQISDKLAYSVEDYVRGPISFFDEQVNLHLVVQLTQDIDLHDWQLESIGNYTANTPFKGFFDGGTHTLSNVNMRNQYLFGYMEDGEIRDLKLTSTHKLALLNKGTTSAITRNLRIIGVSLKADCSVSPIAQSLTGTAYVVGCIHQGDAGGALVGTADNLTMYGCMHASANITGAALLGSYADGSSEFFAPQQGKTLTWGNFMCNYYQKSSTQATNAVGTITDAYRPQEYIRGARQHILRAKNDNLLGDDVPYDKLNDMQKSEFYGLAPWKAMNYAIFQYNQLSVAKASEYRSFPESHQCHMIYKVDDIGYAHEYPELVEGTPTNEGIKNILLLNN